VRRVSELTARRLPQARSSPVLGRAGAELAARAVNRAAVTESWTECGQSADTDRGGTYRMYEYAVIVWIFGGVLESVSHTCADSRGKGPPVSFPAVLFLPPCPRPLPGSCSLDTHRFGSYRAIGPEHGSLVHGLVVSYVEVCSDRGLLQSRQN
jgi:hypothetical protein